MGSEERTTYYVLKKGNKFLSRTGFLVTLAKAPVLTLEEASLLKIKYGGVVYAIKSRRQ